MTRRRQAQFAVAVLTLVVSYWLILPRFASYGDVWPELRSVGRWWLAALLALNVVNLMAPAMMQRAALPGLTVRQAAQSDWVTTAVTNTVPGGSALALGLGWSMYRSWGLDPAPIGRALVVAGIWDNIIKLVTPAIALVWLASEREVEAAFVRAAVLGGLLLVTAVWLVVLVLAGPRAAAIISRLLDWLPFTGEGWSHRSEQIRVDTVALLRTRGAALSFWTLAGHANLYLLLLVCLRAVGVDVSQLSAAAVLAAFAFGRLATAIPLTPGGAGVMEVSLALALDLAGEAATAQVLAALVLFRSLTFLAPIPLGVIGWLLWSGVERQAPVHAEP